MQIIARVQVGINQTKAEMFNMSNSSWFSRNICHIPCSSSDKNRKLPFAPRKEPGKYFIPNTSTQALHRLYLLLSISDRLPRPFPDFTWCAPRTMHRSTLTKAQDSRGKRSWKAEKNGENSTCLQRATLCGIHAPYSEPSLPCSLCLCLVACQCNLCKFIGKYFVIFFLSSFLASLCCRERGVSLFAA